MKDRATFKNTTKQNTRLTKKRNTEPYNVILLYLTFYYNYPIIYPMMCILHKYLQKRKC